MKSNAKSIYYILTAIVLVSVLSYLAGAYQPWRPGPGQKKRHVIQVDMVGEVSLDGRSVTCPELTKAARKFWEEGGSLHPGFMPSIQLDGNVTMIDLIRVVNALAEGGVGEFSLASSKYPGVPVFIRLPGTGMFYRDDHRVPKIEQGKLVVADDDNVQFAKLEIWQGILIWGTTFTSTKPLEAIMDWSVRYAMEVYVWPSTSVGAFFEVMRFLQVHNVETMLMASSIERGNSNAR